jgi:ORF6N domain
MTKMSNARKKTAVTPRPIETLIHVIRGQKVMVDADLAALPTGALNQAVRRNMERFPEDFAFRLSKAEFEHWKSQSVISNPSTKMGLRHAPTRFGHTISGELRVNAPNCEGAMLNRSCARH